MPKGKRRNKTPRKRGKKHRSGRQRCPVGKLVAHVETVDKVPVDGIRVWIKGTRHNRSTVGGSATYDPAPQRTGDAVIDLGDVEGKRMVVTSLEEVPFVAPSGEVGNVWFRLTPMELKLVSVDEQFASSAENLDVEYEIKLMEAKTVQIKIRGFHDELLHVATLGKGEKSDGKHTFRWSGEITHGSKRGSYACPLDGPFKVELVSPGWPTQELPFNVLYASLELELAPWSELYKAHTKETAITAPTAPDKLRAWAAYKLAELGFWAGPPDGTDNADLKSGARRFRLAHPELCGFKQSQTFYRTKTHSNGPEMELKPGDALTKVDGALKSQLEAGTTKGIVGRTALSDEAAIGDKGKATKLFVDNGRFFISEHTEFNSGKHAEDKYAAEQAWLGRPCLPIRCVAKLVDKKGSPKAARAGAGRVPILWTWTDAPESDLRSKKVAPKLPAHAPDAPSRTADYVEHTQTTTKPGSRHGAPKAHGGLLDGTAGDETAPLTANADLHHSTATKAGVGLLTRGSVAVDRPDVLGTPVLYLRPSNIAGDAYRVTAQLHLDDEPNKAELKLLHTKVDPVESGLVAIWRRIRIGAYVAWPKRTGFTLSSELDKVKAELEPCMVELDVSGCEELESKDLFDDAKYGQVLDAAKIGDKDTDDFLDRVKGHKFSDKALYGGPPEACESTFDEFVKHLMPSNSAFTMKLAQAWKQSTDGDVSAAGTHYESALPTAPLVHATQSTAKITAAQVEELLLPKLVRDEIEEYAAGTGTESANTSDLRGHLRTIGKSPKDELYIEHLQLHLDRIMVRSDFKDDVPELFRSWPLDLRKWVVRARIGRLPDLIKSRLAEKLDLLTREKLAKSGKACDGAVMVDYLTSDPVTIRGEPFVVDGVAFGGLNGVVMLDQGLKSKFYSLAAHELGHCMFLQHGPNVGGSAAKDHDESDDNCIMSYPVFYKMAECGEGDRAAFLDLRARGSTHSTKAHYCYDKFKPHFCGKCNLKIRGWKLDSGAPAKAPARPVVAPAKTPTVKLTRDTVATDGKSATWCTDNITTIGISFYPPHKAGSLEAGRGQFRFSKLADFPRGFGDSLDAALDPGTFRVEVKDENVTSEMVYVTLEALKPTYVGGTATGWTEFTGEERKRRALVDVECVPISSDPHTYRSRYIRLVVDEYDHKALANTKQGLLVTDMVTKNSVAADDEVEILDQKIRVWYDPA